MAFPLSTFSPPTEKAINLPQIGSWPASKHQFDETSVWAVRAALASGRPLLLRGEPGIGKSQLARGVAAFLEVPFLSHVVDERTERDELLYQYDAVSRLAQAQMAAVEYRDRPAEDEGWREMLSEMCFIRPGVLWWAINWQSAAEQLEKRYFRKNCPQPDSGSARAEGREAPPCAAVVLIDEIDKADPSVPNGLLECLGNDGFDTPQLDEAVRRADGAPPHWC